MSRNLAPSEETYHHSAKVDRMKLAAIQYRPPKGDPDKARKELLRLVHAAGREGADLIVCPELATTGYMWESPEELIPHSESALGPTYQLLAAAARRASLGSRGGSGAESGCAAQGRPRRSHQA